MPVQVGNTVQFCFGNRKFSYYAKQILISPKYYLSNSHFGAVLCLFGAISQALYSRLVPYNCISLMSEQDFFPMRTAKLWNHKCTVGWDPLIIQKFHTKKWHCYGFYMLIVNILLQKVVSYIYLSNVCVCMYVCMCVIDARPHRWSHRPQTWHGGPSLSWEGLRRVKVGIRGRS